jgi:hypothetical protein
MDRIYNTQASFNNPLDNDFDYFDNAHCVEVAWRREGGLDFYPNRVSKMRYDNAAESFGMYQEDAFCSEVELAFITVK